jgi:hypothetical protein
MSNCVTYTITFQLIPQGESGGRLDIEAASADDLEWLAWMDARPLAAAGEWQDLCGRREAMQVQGMVGGENVL